MDNTILSRYLAMDAAPRTNPTLEAHDRRFHPNGFDPSKDRCKLREELAKGDEADLVEVEAEEAAEAGTPSGAGSSPQDYAKVMEIRDRLEPIARLLNGRAGNIAALQSSSRWPALRDYTQKPLNAFGSPFLSQAQSDINFLDRNILFNNGADPALKQVANQLRDAAEAIIVSGASKWEFPTKMVPAKSDIPTAPAAAPAPVAPAPATPAATAPTSGTPSIDPDDAKAIILRAAKSINHHIDKGDFTPNAKAISDVMANTAAIAALKDPDLDRALSEIDASALNGYKTRIGKVPLPSSAHAPSGGLGGLPSGLLGALAAALGVSAPPKAKAVPGSVTAGPPFSDGPSPYAAYLNSVNAGNPAINDPNAYKDAADALSETDARDILEGPGTFPGFLVKGGYRDSIHPNDPDEKVLWSGWKPSTKLSPDTIRCAAVCFSDLRKRFPDMPWKNNLELRCGTKPFTGGQSTHTADDSRHTVLFNCDYGHIWPDTGLGNGAANYGHPDNRFPFDVLRHEMGHALMSGKLPDGRRMISKWHDAMTKAFGNPAKDLEKFARKYVSHYAVTNKGNGFSMAECLSECFSLATSPDYQPGYLPRPVEDFIFGEMLGVKLS